MTQPYRHAAEGSAAAEATPTLHCPICRVWSAIRRVRFRTVVAASAASIFLMVNVASAVVTKGALKDAKRSLEDAHRARKTAESLDTATRKTLALYEARLQKPTPTSTAEPKIGRSEPRTWRGEGILRASPMEFYVDRVSVDRALDGDAANLGQARLLPVKENGKVSGLEVLGLDPDTLLGKLGIQSGDRIEAVDGLDITRPENVLDAYAILRSANDLDVRVRRHGALLHLRYHLS